MAKDRRNRTGRGSETNEAGGIASAVAEALRTRLAGLATGIGIGVGGGSASGGKNAMMGMIGPLTGVITAISGKIIALLAPLALLGAALSSQVSGMAPFLASIKLVGSLLGAFLAPIFITLSAVIWTLVGVFEDDLIKAAGDFAKMIWQNAIKAIDWFDKQLFGLSETVLKAALGLVDFIDTMRDMKTILEGGNKFGGGQGDEIWEWKKALGQQLEQVQKARADKQGLGAVLGINGGMGNVGNLKEGDIGKMFREGLQNGIQEMRFAAGPRASVMGVADASRQAQLAAFNQSPYEAKMLALNQKILETLEDALGKAMEPAVEN